MGNFLRRARMDIRSNLYGFYGVGDSDLAGLSAAAET
jgi:hypothetical protein